MNVLRSKDTSSVILATITLIAHMGCTRAPEAEVNAKPALERIEEALLSAGNECDSSADCASGVCQMALCRSLVDSDQAWMEHAVADRIKEYLEREPAAAAAFFDERLVSLSQDDPFFRGRLIGFLGHLGDARAIPVLRRWSEEENERVAVLAVLARVRLRDNVAYAAGLELLQHRSEAVRLDALDALAPVLVEAGAVDRVVSLLQSDDYRLRQRAVNVLGAVEPLPEAARAVLESMLQHSSDGFLRGDVLRALHRSQPN